MPATILLLASDAAGEVAADALRRSLDAEIKLLPSVRDGLATLRVHDFSLILLDEVLAATEPAAADRIYQITAVPVLELNLAISGAPRIARQVRAALVRRTTDVARGCLSGKSRGQLPRSALEPYDCFEGCAVLKGIPEDPADRQIGATAFVHGLKLVTADKKILKSVEVACV